MELSSIIKPEAIKVTANVTSKKRLFQELAELTGTCHNLNVSDAVDALQDRENLGPTGVGNGVALPHARLTGLNKIIGVFMRLEAPIDFGSPDRRPVDLVFGLFAPAESGVEHLRALAAVSRTMREDSVCTKLRANSDSAILFDILTEARIAKAA